MEGGRGDGRGPLECRATFLRTGVVGGATGSAYLEVGRSTRMVVSVWGPRQRDRDGEGSSPHEMQLDCHVHLPFARGEAEEAAGSRGTERERTLARQLEQGILPSIQQDRLKKCCVEVQCTILESNGSDFTPAILCTSFALASSNIPLYDLMTSCTLVVVEGRILLDPTAAELARSEDEVSLAYMPSRDQVTFVQACGDWSERSFKECMDNCVDGCKKMRAVMRSFLVELGEGGGRPASHSLDYFQGGGEVCDQGPGAGEDDAGEKAPMSGGDDDEPRREGGGGAARFEESRVSEKLGNLVVADQDLDAELDTLLDV
ncbi:exosome complex exonuclease [Chloropicon primus]|uniref:Exosome complex exonuclease n=2 Tax=Chloropicon primus TaxID=1764295 RepID=A0A5B8MMM3_9CHLO|nr:exosome complex exonuclease [Chloropicon primus]UPQ99823.1 exosome complex exonuclease [Chloropicon primus]|eukprot:QDZ20612.1 exosome complex exonuclease [Chloropicon primus]